MTEAVRRRPYSVVLLDEIEKAHPEVRIQFHYSADIPIVVQQLLRYSKILDFLDSMLMRLSSMVASVISLVKWYPSRKLLVLRSGP